MEDFNNKITYKSRIESFSSNSKDTLKIIDDQIYDLSDNNEFCFTYSFPEIKNVVGLKLSKIDIPFTYYIINENNNIFNWVSYDILPTTTTDGTNSFISSAKNTYDGINPVYYTAKITDYGYYSPDEFGRKIAKIMSDSEPGITSNNLLSIYIISAENNKLIVKEKINSDIKYLVIEIPNGNYNLSQIIDFLKTNLNNASKTIWSTNHFEYSFSYQYSTKKVILNHDLPTNGTSTIYFNQNMYTTDGTNWSNSTSGTIINEVRQDSYMSLGNILGFNDIVSLSNDGTTISNTTVLENLADSDPWFNPWQSSDTDFKLDKYKHCYDPISNRISITRTYGKFSFFKHFYENKKLNTIEKCLGFKFNQLEGIKEPDSANTFNINLFKDKIIGDYSPLPNGSNYINLNLGHFFNNYNNSNSNNTRDLSSSNIIRIPINNSYKNIITYTNDTILEIFSQNLSSLNIKFSYPDDVSIMNEGSGGIPVNFNIEFIYDDSIDF